MEAVSENRENALATPTKKMSKTISERLKKSAGKVFDEVKETLNRPSRRNSDAELVKDTPEKVAQGQVAPSTTDGKGSTSKRQRSWRALSSTLKSSLRKTFNFGNSSISEVGEDVMKVFGADLDQVLIQERLVGVQTSTGVPTIVEECLRYLIPAHVEEEGLFRISGMKEDIMAWRQKVDVAAGQGTVIHIESEPNCHNISGLLKQYIRELPSSLYPKVLHQELISAGKMEEAGERLAALQAIAKQLPYSNFALLRRLTCVLKDLLDHVEKTKMTSANLSTVWAPNLIWDRDTETDPTTCLAFSRDVNLAIQFTIEVAYDMFKVDEAAVAGLITQSEAPKRRSVFDIQPELVHASTSEPSSISPSSTSSDAMDVSEPADPSRLSPRELSSSDTMIPVTPCSPGFEEMLELANSSRKRPRSIWIGSSATLNEELDSMAETSSPLAPSSSNSSASRSSTKVRSSKRRTRISSIGTSSIGTSTTPSLSTPAQIDEEEGEPSAKRRKVTALPEVLEPEIHQFDSTVPSPRELAVPSLETGLPSPRKSSGGIRASLRKSLRLGTSRSSSRTSTHANALSNASLPEIQLYYYMDSDPNSVALRKLLASLHFIPREIRNAQNDPMSVDEAVFFAQTCHDIVVVKRTDKAYTVSHKIADLSQTELRSFLSNASGEPRSPAIIAGSTYIVGYDKQLKDIFKYYMHRTKKTSTPLSIPSK